MTSKGLVVLIVDDHPVFRRGRRSVLEDTPWVAGIVEAAGVEEAVRAAVTGQVDVVAMDLVLPDGNGLEATARILRARPGMPVLILTMHNHPGLTGPLLAAGARGYLVKETDSDLIVDALHALSQGATLLGPHLNSASVIGGVEPRRPRLLEGLSPRERAILTELAAGRTNPQIGRSLGLSEKTVRNQLSALYVKLGVSDRTQAALRAREAGLKPPQ